MTECDNGVIRCRFHPVNKSVRLRFILDVYALLRALKPAL